MILLSVQFPLKCCWKNVKPQDDTSLGENSKEEKTGETMFTAIYLNLNHGQVRPFFSSTLLGIQEPLSCLTTTKNLITEHTVLHAEIQMGLDDFQKCLGRTYEYQENYLASTAKRQKIEVKTKDLTPEEAKLFAKAKDKELDSWLATDTVRKILRHQVPKANS